MSVIVYWGLQKMPSKSLFASSLLGTAGQCCNFREGFSRLPRKVGCTYHQKILAYGRRHSELKVAMEEKTAQGRPRAAYLIKRCVAKWWRHRRQDGLFLGSAMGRWA
jgi:hypothetical protein